MSAWTIRSNPEWNFVTAKIKKNMYTFTENRTRPGTIHLTHDSIRLLYLQFDSIIFFLISE